MNNTQLLKSKIAEAQTVQALAKLLTSVEKFDDDNDTSWADKLLEEADELGFMKKAMYLVQGISHNILTLIETQEEIEVPFLRKLLSVARNIAIEDALSRATRMSTVSRLHFLAEDGSSAQKAAEKKTEEIIARSSP